MYFIIKITLFSKLNQTFPYTQVRYHILAYFTIRVLITETLKLMLGFLFALQKYTKMFPLRKGDFLFVSTFFNAK